MSILLYWDWDPHCGSSLTGWPLTQFRTALIRNAAGSPPDLRAGGAWFNCRLTSLFKAAKEYGRRWVDLVIQGLDALAQHRRNYDATGANPEQLQVLWWEFPREHWDALREGSQMNFVDPPDACICFSPTPV